MRILLADNDVEYRRALAHQIEEMGHVALEAMSATEVLECCREKCPDLIVMDIKLSGSNGAEFVKEVRRLGGLAVWNPVILMGKEATKEDYQAGIDVGADHFFLKPIPDMELKYAINSAIRHQDLKEQVFSVAHELVMANRALEGLGTQDIMTGISDIKAFHQSLENHWFRSRREKTTLSLIFLNLDFFHEYNDQYGSEKGDQVIKQVASTLKKALPKKYDMLARTTGDTFAILLPETPSDQAMEIAKKLYLSIDALKVTHNSSHCSDHLTSSVGVTSSEDENFKTPLDMMEAADYALYQAKHKGRNQICFVATAYS